MSDWEKVKINSFLKERAERISPYDANELNLKRIEKIDFSGNIHMVENKNTKTNMIRVKSGDLVISGINVQKGALAIYEGENDVLATIHYSSYEYDKNKIDIEYLKWFLKSEIFIKILNEQSGGGIKTELKAKKFLSLYVFLPDIDTQYKIVERIKRVEKQIIELEKINIENEEMLTRLKTKILEDCMRGKMVLQNSTDESGTNLLKKIKNKIEIKKESNLSIIKESEKPYDLPNGWEWVRLGEITMLISGQDLNSSDCNNEKRGIPYVVGASDMEGNLLKHTRWTEKPKSVAIKGDIIISVKGTIGKILLLEDEQVHLSRQVKSIRVIESDTRMYIYFYINKMVEEIKGKGNGIIPGIKNEDITTMLVPFPPLSEQKRIVTKIIEINKTVHNLENAIKESKIKCGKLLKTFLTEVFKEK